MRFDCKDDIIQLTPEWKGERFPNGRPRVPDAVLNRLRQVTFEEAWGPLWGQGYKYQWECDFKLVHPDTKLVGRAVTAVMVPMRPDLHKTLLDYGHQTENRRGFFNQWVIDQLSEDDVVVVDLFDKIAQGTYVGGNLSTAIATRTKRGGAVIWGGIRDLEQIVKIKETQTFYRGVDPTGIGDVTMTGMNVPCRIGKAICMPGDVVLGTISGVIFIPPQLAEAVATQAEKSHVRDIFGFIRLAEKTYTTAQIDTAWTLPMWQDFINWFKNDPQATPYQHLTWDKELEKAQTTAANNTQVRL
ncbi:MAG: RraA family protein [Lentisphaeria bacterium]|nr:RraA family protein [Lentisphaeria bacterium]